MTRFLIAVACTILMLAGCGGTEPGDGTAADEKTPDRVTGVILEIESESLEEVTSFRLKVGDVTYEIFIADDIDYGFPLGHLQEHLSTAEPVTVDLEVREDDRLYALTIEDV